jgi:hypothetical protein
MRLGHFFDDDYGQPVRLGGSHFVVQLDLDESFTTDNSVLRALEVTADATALHFTSAHVVYPVR